MGSHSLSITLNFPGNYRALFYISKMSVELKSSKKDICLVGEVNHYITGAKLPSNRQVLAVLFFRFAKLE